VKIVNAVLRLGWLALAALTLMEVKVQVEAAQQRAEIVARIQYEYYQMEQFKFRMQYPPRKENKT
jgi:hypothetical protein